MTSKFVDIINGFRKVERHILLLIAAELCLQMVNTAFFLLLNYFLEKEGYTDAQIGRIISYRFMAVMLLAAPFGFFIKGKRLKPFFLIGATLLPIFSLLVIHFASLHSYTALNFCIIFWGIAFALFQITGLPYILLNAKEETHSEAITMYFQTWGLTIFICGVSYYLLQSIDPLFFTEKLMIQALSIFSFSSLFFLYKIKVKEHISKALPIRKIKKATDLIPAIGDVLSPYDWPLIASATIPTFIIAIGAGFTIPVINLFFLNVHGVDSDIFSLMGAFTYLFVAFGMIFIPTIRRNYGYKVAITLFQSLAILALFFMATSEYYAHWEYAVYVAIFFYLIRQPLMNVAGPMTSELTMYFVGKKNQEMVSALNASIWSGSWFISMQIFAYLRQSEWRYVSIFLITIVLYVIGVIWYAFLIKSYENRTKEENKNPKKENELTEENKSPKKKEEKKKAQSPLDDDSILDSHLTK